MALKLAFCSVEQIEETMHFLRDHWSANHVLASSRALMEWQHKSTDKQRYNLALALDDNGIHGLLGVIPISQYDSALASTDTAWLTTWKVREGTKYGGLGLKLLRFVEQNIPHEMIGTVGNNDLVARFYAAMGYRTGRLTQFALINRARSNYHLIAVTDPHECPSPPEDQPPIKPIHEFADGGLDRFKALFNRFDQSEIFPKRSLAFYQNRYLTSPFYHYRLFGIGHENALQALFIVRSVEANGSRALRIVDYFGPPEAFLETGPAFRSLLGREQAEYVDFYATGFPEEIPCQAGFFIVDPMGSVTIPNYYEPFVRKNVTINYAYKIKRKETARFVAFKGDCDQDRPSILPKDVP
ncbi:MAG: hypothetical protein HQL67_08615 [Magnetococcales bacterium]|nr:hypothetical protein [Magnetococcales bacterium]